jgi:glycosyltransferase involved in cell wall biosynthesis
MVKILQKQGRELDLQAHVSEEALHAAYEQCCFTVFPSLLEGFGLPIIESLWHGRPVVCGMNGALGEVASGGGCETADPRNAESLAAAIRLLLKDEAHYQKLHDETRNRIFLSWSDYWENVMAAINQIRKK